MPIIVASHGEFNPTEIKKALIIHPVSHASEILGIVFNTKMSNKNTKQKVHKENMGKVLPLPKSRKKN
ncbi:MAG TPA: hypothetical protein LFW10_02750 [Rickettsia endosymbiont of Diachasma alloeum]|nr:hypothetical protein [Rickettsia endosymbiont of Diachasma alloeum]